VEGYSRCGKPCP